MGTPQGGGVDSTYGFEQVGERERGQKVGSEALGVTDSPW
jgi:hypothetical protein